MARIQVSLEEVARTGWFGPLQLGLSRPEVQALLGPPTGTNGLRKSTKNTGVIWAYGDIEFHFGVEPDLLNGVSCATWDPPLPQEVPTAGPTIDLDPWVFRTSLTRDVLLRALDAAHISYQEMPQAGGAVFVMTAAGF